MERNREMLRLIGGLLSVVGAAWMAIQTSNAPRTMLVLLSPAGETPNDFVLHALATSSAGLLALGLCLLSLSLARQGVLLPRIARVAVVIATLLSIIIVFRFAFTIWEHSVNWGVLAQSPIQPQPQQIDNAAKYSIASRKNVLLSFASTLLAITAFLAFGVPRQSDTPPARRAGPRVVVLRGVIFVGALLFVGLQWAANRTDQREQILHDTRELSALQALVALLKPIYACELAAWCVLGLVMVALLFLLHATGTLTSREAVETSRE